MHNAKRKSQMQQSYRVSGNYRVVTFGYFVVKYLFVAVDRKGVKKAWRGPERSRRRTVSRLFTKQTNVLQWGYCCKFSMS